MRFLATVAVCAVAALAGGCSNPFLAHYQGTTFPRTKSASTVAEPPVTTVANLIGVSTFSSTLDLGNAPAVSAAEEVGANYVHWDRSYQGKTTQLELRPIFGPYSTGAAWAEGGSLVDVETPVQEKWYRYHARFYRDVGGS